MKMLFAAARERGCGTKLLILDVCYTVAVGGKTDVPRVPLVRAATRVFNFRFMNMNLVEATSRSPHLQRKGQNPRFSANENGDDTCERKFSPCSLFR
jgi:hypothetical protein